jgi:small subunit ribosomal protein S8
MTFVTDPIGDLLTRMRNAQAARSTMCRAPHSRIKEELLQVLKRGGWIADVSVEGEEPKQELVVTFAEDKTLRLQRISKPGRRVYCGVEELKPVLRGYGVALLTTSEGILTDEEARKRKLGGEVLCTIS